MLGKDTRRRVSARTGNPVITPDAAPATPPADWGRCGSCTRYATRIRKQVQMRIPVFRAGVLYFWRVFLVGILVVLLTIPAFSGRGPLFPAGALCKNIVNVVVIPDVGTSGHIC